MRDQGVVPDPYRARRLLRGSQRPAGLDQTREISKSSGSPACWHPVCPAPGMAKVMLALIGAGTIALILLAWLAK